MVTETDKQKIDRLAGVLEKLQPKAILNCDELDVWTELAYLLCPDRLNNSSKSTKLIPLLHFLVQVQATTNSLRLLKRTSRRNGLIVSCVPRFCCCIQFLFNALLGQAVSVDFRKTTPTFRF